MPTLAISFTGGHYHATPWNKAQNEGAVEWPPSPWRIIRALIATGYAKLPGWRDGIMPDTAKGLIEKLAATLPVYRLPKAVVGSHTRHYMPTKGKTTLVIDARAILGVKHEPLLVHWDAELSPEEENLLAELAACLSYLGRAESWTECELQTEESAEGADNWTRPCDSVAPDIIGPGWEQIPLMTPLTVEAYAAWRQAAFDNAFVGSRSSAAERRKFDALYPVELINCLQVETGWLQAKGWTQPPGSRMVLYWRPAQNAIGVTAPAPAKRASRTPAQFALLALAAAHICSRSAMPLVTRTLPQAELLHQAIAGSVGRIEQERERIRAAAELLGLDADRRPLSGHRHAHILPLSLLKDDNHLDHILIWSPDGLGDAAQGILRCLRKTYMKGGVGELSVRLAGVGRAEDFMGVERLRPILSKAHVWQSRTPLVLPRHRKKNGRNTPDGQIIAELSSRGLPMPEKIEWLHEERINFRYYIRTRRNKVPAESYGYALRLTFADPVSGPLCLGYASHFGLGLFAPVEEGSN